MKRRRILIRSLILTVSIALTLLSVQSIRAYLGYASPLFFQGPGIAPTGDPGLGFDIEGNLVANNPNANTTDWVPGSAGTGIGVFSSAGVPLDPLKTFRLVDVYNSQTDNIISGGAKYIDNPNTWTWTTQKSTAKDDINNGLLHISTDQNGHLWLMVAGDRFSTNGNSYIDFEFLQNTLTVNDNGTFTSSGPDGGRTVGDLLLTLELTQGGTQPEFFIERWQQTGPGVFSYVALTPAANTVFAAANLSGTVSVPFGAFGSGTYAMNAFAEGAVDISALISTLDPCVLIKTLLVKTKASAQQSASLKDFITPLQLNLGTSPAANAGIDLISCQAVPGPTVFTINGTAINGTPSWSVIGSTGTALANIVSPNSATTNVNVTGTGTVTLRLSVSNQLCGIATDDVVLEVSPNAIADAGPDMSSCQDPSGTTTFTIDSVVTSGASINWTVMGTTGTASPVIVSPNSASTDVNVTGTGTVTLKITANAGNCGIATDTIVLTVTPSPTSNAGSNQAKCQHSSGTTVFSLNGSVTNGTPSWNIVGTTGTAGATIISPNSASTNVNVTGTGTVTLALVSTSNTNPSCGTATSEVVLTVNALPNANAGPDKLLTCNVTSVQLDGSSTTPGATFSWSGPNAFSSNIAKPTVTVPGTYTLTVTNPATGCTAIDTVVVNQDVTAPNANAGLDKTLNCSVTQVTLNGSSTTIGATFSWTGPNGFTSGIAEPTVTVPGTYILTVFIPNTGCTAIDSVVVSQNITPPNVSAGADKTLSCNVTQVVLDGSSTTQGVTFSWTGPGGFTSTQQSPSVTVPGTYTLTVTNPANGCTASDTVVISQNSTLPNVNAGPDKTLTCLVTQVVLSGSSTTQGVTFSWSGPLGFTSNQAMPTVSVPGTYTLTVTDPANGCMASDTTVISQNNSSPNVNAGPDKVLTCAVPQIVLNGSSTTQGVTFSWSGPGGFSSNSATPSVSVPGTYTLTITDPANGCTSTDTVLVTRDDNLPDVNAGPNKTLSCSVTSVILNGSSTTPSVTFSWSGPNGFTSNQASPSVTAPGTYTLTVTNPANGCSASDSVEVTQDTSTADATITSPDEVCAGATGLSASVPNAGQGAVYTWSITNGLITGGLGTANIVWTAGASGTTTLNVTITTANGCSTGKTKQVAINPLPAGTITAPSSVCELSTGNSASVPNAGTGATYQWSINNGIITAGQGTTNITWSSGSSGNVTLSVLITSGKGCTANGSAQIPITRLPIVSAGVDLTISACATSVGLSGTISGGATSATWSGGQGAFIPNANTLKAAYVPTPAELAAGKVTLKLTTNDPTGNCGSASDEVMITFTACADLSLFKSLDNPNPNTGDNVTFTINVINSGPTSATKVSVLDLLPQGLTFISATATQGSYNSSTGIWSIGTIGIGKTATLRITAKFSAGAQTAINCAEIYASDAEDPDSTPNNRVTSEDDYDCVPFESSKGPGQDYPASTEGSDQIAGSVLIFPIYSSNSSRPNLHNTRISITNVSQTEDIAVKLMFVDGSTCSIADGFICLTKGQTTSFLVSDFDPDVSGYLVAVAVDCNTGHPINFNCLIGDEYVKFSTGHRGNLGAETFNALRNNPTNADNSSTTATLKFDGRSYTRLPMSLVADNLPSKADGNDTMIIINRIGGSMLFGANKIGPIFGILYNDVEIAASFTADVNVCQFRSTLSNSFPRSVPRYETHIPAGRSGWMKFWAKDDAPGGLIGVSINANPNSIISTSAYNGAHNLHHQTLTASSELTIPIFPPNCC